MIAVNLRTEYLKNPIGIDITKPRVSWNCTEGKQQEAYEIEVASDTGKVLWNSGEVVSHQGHSLKTAGSIPASATIRSGQLA